MNSKSAERAEQLEGLWRNCADSITHALTHFGDASQSSNSFHDRKWAILSIAHAAEVYGNLLLCMFNPKHPERPDGHYPSLDGVRKMLRGEARLTASESWIFEVVFQNLATQRNGLMHMPADEVLPVSDAAMALLALLHIIRRRTDLDTQDFFDQHPPIEADVFGEIDHREHRKWFDVAERLALDDYGRAHLDRCNACGCLTLPPDRDCQACFCARTESLGEHGV